MSKLYGEWAFIWEALTPDDAYCDESLLGNNIFQTEASKYREKPDQPNCFEAIGIENNVLSS